MIIIVLKMKTTTIAKANHVITNHLKLCFHWDLKLELVELHLYMSTHT